MGYAFMHGFGGGGEKLNFRIKSCIGNDVLPDSAQENTVAVVTRTGITGYCFASQMPEEVREGMVWIRTGTGSRGPFSATKADPILLYPLGVKQYENGQWVEKSGWIYQNGAWVLWWDGQLYTPGNEWHEITGGWASRGAKASSASDEQAVQPVLTKSAEGITADGSAGGGMIYCANKIDLTPYHTLTFEGSFSRGGTLARNVLAACWSELETYYTETEAHQGLNSTSGSLLTVDISGLTGEYYVGMGLTASTAQITGCYLQ